MLAIYFITPEVKNDRRVLDSQGLEKKKTELLSTKDDSEGGVIMKKIADR